MTTQSEAEAALASAGVSVDVLKSVVSDLVNSAVSSETRSSSNYRDRQTDSDVDSVERIRAATARGDGVLGAVSEDLVVGLAKSRARLEAKLERQQDELFQDSMDLKRKIDDEYLSVNKTLNNNRLVQQAASALSSQQSDMTEQLHAIDRLFGIEEGSVQAALAKSVADLLAAKAA